MPEVAEQLDTPTRLAMRLEADHKLIEDGLREMMAAVDGRRWERARKMWPGLLDTIEEHFLLEEEEFFPCFPLRSVAEQLVAEHETIRAQLERMTAEVLLRRATVRDLHALMQLIRRHAASEDELLYPWIGRAPKA